LQGMDRHPGLMRHRQRFGRRQGAGVVVGAVAHQDDGRAQAAPYPHSTEGRASGAPWQQHIRTRPGPAAMPEPPGDRPLLIVGEGDFDPPDLARAAGLLGWPVLATAMSGVRGGGVVTTYHHLLVDGVPPSLSPDWLLIIGRIGPSDRLAALTGLEVPQVRIDRWGLWHDPRRSATHLLQADPVATLETLRSSGDTGFHDSWARADAAMRAALDNRLGEEEAPTGPAVARALDSIVFDRLVAASSMPVRDVDAHTVRSGRVIANRGASGIDGLVSTALGVASVGGRTVALAGDLSFLHDAGGLVVDHLGDVVFVVIDNGGGGLFDLLPQAEHAPGFERLFVAPHGLDLRQLTAAYRLGSSVVNRVDELAARVTESIESGGPHVVVVPVDRETDLKLRRSLDDLARAVCSAIS